MKHKTAGIASIIVITLSIVSILSANTYAQSAADYWPAWRGPSSTGSAGPNANPPVKWSETENIKWKKEIPGDSMSTPIIWDNKIFFLTAVPADNKELKFDFVCMDRNTGKIIWQKTAKQEAPHEGKHNTGSYAAYSPVTDGKYVWASFGSHGVYCYDVNGTQIWGKDLGKMNIRMTFGEGSSAALAGDAIVVVMDNEKGSAIYALDKMTGNQIWKKDRDEGTAWATPLPIQVNGKWQIVTSATKLIRSYNLENGDLIWQCSGQTSNVIPSPVTGFGMVYCISGFMGSSLQAIELGRTGDLSGTDAIKWQVKKDTPYVPSPLLYGDKIYFLSSNNEVLSCYQAKDGKANYTAQKLAEAKGYYSSPVGAADRIYLASQNGVTMVIKNSDKYEVLTANKLDDRFDASPVIVGKELILKGKKYIYCIAEK
jgi:outer membrane protein assembly factor BamB